MSRKKNPPTAADLLGELVALVLSDVCNPTMRAQAVRIAYETGKSEGRLEGAKSMGDSLIASLDKSLDKAAAGVGQGGEMSEPKETYLGEGVYASFDGYYIRLRAARGREDHFIYLDTSTHDAFEDFLDALRTDALNKLLKDQA